MGASFLIWLPIAVWALILLGYAFVRTRRDRIEHRDRLTGMTGSALDEN